MRNEANVGLEDSACHLAKRTGIDAGPLVLAMPAPQTAKDHNAKEAKIPVVRLRFDSAYGRTKSGYSWDLAGLFDGLRSRCAVEHANFQSNPCRWVPAGAVGKAWRMANRPRLAWRQWARSFESQEYSRRGRGRPTNRGG